MINISLKIEYISFDNIGCIPKVFSQTKANNVPISAYFPSPYKFYKVAISLDVFKGGLDNFVKSISGY